MAHPKPAALQEASGAFDHDPQRRRYEPECSGPLGDPPAFLDDLERQAWIELEQLAPRGVLKNADRLLIEQLARLVAQGRRRNDSGDVICPLKAAERNLIIAGLREMGLTPVGRAKLAGKNPPDDDKPADDQFSKFRKQ